MFMWDFTLFWNIGRALLSGGDPYAVQYSCYPPAMNYFFALLALLPLQVGFGAWTAANLVMQLFSVRRSKNWGESLAWLLFAPTLFVAGTGQTSILFFWLSSFLSSGGWKTVLAASLLTLKPQIALMILPWHVLRWLKSERKLLLQVGAASLALHLFPLIFDVNIYAKWLAAVQAVANYKLPKTSGVFGLVQLDIPLWILAIMAALILLWGLFQDERTCRAAMLLSSPVTIWYDDVILAGSAPVWLMVPFSWLVFYLSYYVHRSTMPFLLIPLAMLAWKMAARWRERRAQARSMGR